jgi:hypothetical protein
MCVLCGRTRPKSFPALEATLADNIGMQTSSSLVVERIGIGATKKTTRCRDVVLLTILLADTQGIRRMMVPVHTSCNRKSTFPPLIGLSSSPSEHGQILGKW